MRQNETRLQDTRNNLQNLDTALNRYLDLGAVSKGLAKREEQEPERRELVRLINESQKRIDDFLTERSEYQLQINSFEVEIGLIKYISALIYGDEALDYIDTAVRAVILTLVFVFDPLAVFTTHICKYEYARLQRTKKKNVTQKKKELEEKNKGKVKTTVTNEENGMKKITKEQNGVSMSYYE